MKKSTQKQREQLMRLLKEDKLGARSIDTIKPSDAKEWALRMKDKGFSYNTINNHKRSLKASFYIAIQDDCVRKNPFDFKLNEVLENDTKEKVALTEEQEQALLSFIKTDNVYHKHYDDVLILLKTGLRISELCGLTVADIDFKNEVVIIDHQLLKSLSLIHIFSPSQGIKYTDQVLLKLLLLFLRKPLIKYGVHLLRDLFIFFL